MLAKDARKRMQCDKSTFSRLRSETKNVIEVTESFLSRRYNHMDIGGTNLMEFDLVEGNLILDALNGYGEYHLPRSMSRKTLYILIKKFVDMLGIRCDNGYSIPNIFQEKFDKTKSFELDLNDDEMDYINRAIQAGNYQERSEYYPKDIQEAADRVYHKTLGALMETPEITPENGELFKRIFGAT
jgi:hypothetical protein